MLHYALFFSFHDGLTGLTWGEHREHLHKRDAVNVLFLHNWKEVTLVPCSKVVKDSPRSCGPCPRYDTVLDPLHYHVFGLLLCGVPCVALCFGKAAATLRSPWPLVALLCETNKHTHTLIFQ